MMEDKLDYYKKAVQVPAREEAVQRTIQMSKEAFFKSEQEGVLSYREFLWTQLKTIQKRWWIFQLFLLLALWAVLLMIQDDLYIQRSMGVIAALFVILIIPEVWKNRSCQSIEIEAAAYYSLRQIYAARILLFGLVDVFLITIFCGTATLGLHYELSQLLVQFLFPLSVTACICFGTLCSKHSFSENVAIILCVIWSAVWLFIILNETIYTRITFSVWLSLVGMALVYLVWVIFRILNNCNKFWEVSFDGIGNV